MKLFVAGMFGKSWGGFNGLQVAACQPPALKAVISTYSSDDRYNDDVHYRDGCILGNEMLSWAHTMFMWNARPPHPKSLGTRYGPSSWCPVAFILTALFDSKFHSISERVQSYNLIV